MKNKNIKEVLKEKLIKGILKSINSFTEQQAKGFLKLLNTKDLKDLELDLKQVSYIK